MRVREIVEKYFNNNYSERIRSEFFLWFKDSNNEEHKESAIKQIWDNLDICADESTEQSLNNLISVIEESTFTQKKQKRSLTHKFSRIAAILLLPLLATGITYYIMKSVMDRQDSVRMVECIVPDGKVYTITLPDSSIVKVNAGSILVYPEKFTKHRDVFLNGEAYFTVSKDEKKPFVVKTTDMDIEVLGTIFNISSYADSDNSSATLERGKVNVSFKNVDETSMILLPNEQVTYNRISRLIEKSTVKVSNTIAWIDGNLIIQSMSINEVIKVIERKYAMKVYLNSNDFNNERITMKITHKENIVEFMEVLRQLVPKMKYKIDNDKLYIN